MAGAKGKSLSDLSFKLKSLKGPLRELNKESYSDIKRVIKANDDIKNL